MNNKKILIVGVLAVIVTMMVGYALFSETITINGTATAKGDFSITTTCQAGLTDNIKNLSLVLEVAEEYKEGGYFNDTCTVNGNTVSFSANLKYPGATRFFTIALKNTGSINAQLADLSYSETNACIDNDGDDIAETCSSRDYRIGAMTSEPFALVKEDGTIIDLSDEDVDFSEFLTDDDTLIVKPGQSLIVIGIINWDDRLDYNNQLFKIETTYTFNFTQYNN